ncbi:MAG: rhodanese-like domain-containing protein [Candidatus Endonucleobacter bathymodioli]|uniref:Rhodanese-like domain-containing protein n=1 Tax=Candidatus Endonucleibacter bathymodioli TaxID=539814 RepID=A0AA90NQI2_9GAMM|nr:rhodanese-like domain-containing protein [Candidatus Endonucleobacter bathymodioli]
MKWMYGLFIVLFSLISVAVSAEEVPVYIKGVITVNSHQAKRLHDLGAIFLDVRSEDQWLWGHIEGSHNLDLNGGFRQLFTTGTLNQDIPIVIYGNSSYHMGGAIASYLATLWGYTKVFFFRDGYFSWLALDYSVVLISDLN